MATSPLDHDPHGDSAGRGWFPLDWNDPEHRRLITLLGRAGLLIGAIIVLVFAVSRMIGEGAMTPDGSIDFAALLGNARDTAWAPVLVMAIFILLNFAGIPQFLLVGGTVIVFGPLLGFLYAWAATMVSSSVGFWLGHFFGGELLRRYAGDHANGFSRLLGRHGIAASAIVRVVPAGPAIMVNMALGVSHVDYLRFLMGTALGIAPKIALIALVGDGMLAFVQNGNVLMLVMVAGLIAAWVGFMIYARRAFNRWREKQARDMGLEDLDPATPPPHARDAGARPAVAFSDGAPAPDPAHRSEA